VTSVCWTRLSMRWVWLPPRPSLYTPVSCRRVRASIYQAGHSCPEHGLATGALIALWMSTPPSRIPCSSSFPPKSPLVTSPTETAAGRCGVKSRSCTACRTQKEGLFYFILYCSSSVIGRCVQMRSVWVVLTGVKEGGQNGESESCIFFATTRYLSVKVWNKDTA
jgi:hypothetical protein